MVFLCLCSSQTTLISKQLPIGEPRDLQIYSPRALRSALLILKGFVFDMASHQAVPGGKMEPSRKRRSIMRWRNPLYSTTPRENSSVYCQSAGMCEDRVPWVTLVAPPRTARSGFEFRVSRPPLAVSQLLASWTLHTLEGVTSVSAVSKVLQPVVLNQQQKSRIWPPTNQQWQRMVRKPMKNRDV